MYWACVISQSKAKHEKCDQIVNQFREISCAASRGAKNRGT